MKRSLFFIGFLIVLLISSFNLPLVFASTVETRYMRSDTQTINGLLAYILGTAQSASVLYGAGGAAGKLTVYWASDVAIRHADSSETSLGAKVGQVSRNTVSSGVQSASWTCPLTALVSTDAVVTRVYDKYGTGSWNLKATFITEQLSTATQLDNVAWAFYYYTSRDYDVDSGTAGAFYWGHSSYNSCITNFSWTPTGGGPLSFYGSASLTYVASLSKTVSFSREGTSTLTFQSSTQKTMSMTRQGIVSLAFTLGKLVSFAFGKEGMVSLGFASSMQKTMQLNRYGEAQLTFTSISSYLSGIFIRLFGSASLAFTSDASRLFEFYRYGSSALTFATDYEKLISTQWFGTASWKFLAESIQTSTRTLSFFGSSSLNFMANLYKTMVLNRYGDASLTFVTTYEKALSLARYGSSSLTFVAEAFRSLARVLTFEGSANLNFLSEQLRTFTFNRYGMAPLSFIVEGLTEGLGRALAFFGSASLIFTIQTTCMLGETLQNAKIFVAAAFIMAILIGIPILVLLMSRKRS